MQIKRYRKEDADSLWQLVFNTVHRINAADYTPAQINAWAPQEPDRAWWERELSEKSPLVLCEGDAVYGYADVQPDGHINHFFVAHDCQRQGKGTVLLKALIDAGRTMGLKSMTVEASVTARPFFEHHGFVIFKEETDAVLRGETFHLFCMRKILSQVSEI